MYFVRIQGERRKWFDAVSLGRYVTPNKTEFISNVLTFLYQMEYKELISGLIYRPNIEGGSE